MAFLAPAVRWPDAIGLNATAVVLSVQPRLPVPLAHLSPDLLLSIVLSFAFIALLTTASAILQARRGRTREARISAGPSGASSRRNKRSEVLTVLLAGPSGVGKTSLYSAMAFKSVPSVHPSQRESESVVSLRATALPNGMEAEAHVTAGTAQSVRIVDTPGHPRIKDAIIGDYMPSTDVLVVCIDAKEALRGSAGLGAAAPAKENPLIEAVDHLHQALVQLAKSRRVASKTAAPPRLVILFTRADLSPHLANVSLAAASQQQSDEGKRRAILLGRARTAVETELGRRRVGMGFGARRTTKVGGMGKVTGGEGSTSLWATIKVLLGLGNRGSSGAGSGSGSGYGDEEDDDDDDTLLDYVDWDTLERNAAKASSAASGAITSASTTSLERLDPDVVCDGRAVCAFASVGKERGWNERDVEGIYELQRILAET